MLPTKTPLLLKFQRVEDCTNKPFELHLARVQKWGFGLGAALATGRSTIPGNPRRKAPSDRAACERYDDRNAGYNASERFDDTD